jgi:hypothetical protein
MARNADTLCRIFDDLVPQCPHRDAKQVCRRRSVPTGMRERLQNQIPFDVSQGRADQPSSETAARRRGNRSVRLHASHCATPVHNTQPWPASEHSKKVNDFLTRPRSRCSLGRLLAVDPISKFSSSQPARAVRDDQSEIPKILSGRDATAAALHVGGWQGVDHGKKARCQSCRAVRVLSATSRS